MWIDAAVAGKLLADERLAQAMTGAAGRLLDDRLDVEDAVQTARATLLASFTTRPREIDNFAPYAVTATTNRAIGVAKAKRRRDQRQLPDPDAEMIPDPGAEAEIETTEERLKLLECLGLLPSHHRMALIMHLNGMTYRDIGEQLGRPGDTVRGWLPKIRAQMRRCLEGRGNV